MTAQFARITPAAKSLITKLGGTVRNLVVTFPNGTTERYFGSSASTHYELPGEEYLRSTDLSRVLEVGD